jgi:hypothetical protein
VRCGVVLVCLAATARGVGAGPATAAQTSTSESEYTPSLFECPEVRPYGEVSAFAGGGTSGAGFLQRTSLGLLVYGCDADRESVALRISPTLAIHGGSLGLGPTSPSEELHWEVGGEVELTVPLRWFGVGIRAGIESHNGNLATGGLRFRSETSPATLAIDGFYSETDYYGSPRDPHGAGVLVGASYDGRPGALGSIGLVVLAGAAAILSSGSYR